MAVPVINWILARASGREPDICSTARKLPTFSSANFELVELLVMM